LGTSGPFVEHVRRFWALHPRVQTWYHGKLVFVNSAGLRGREIPRKDPSELRILLLGDSCVFGHGVEQEQTIDRRLEQRLGPLWSTPVRVMNGGIPGYSSFQGVDLMREISPTVQPDILVVAYGYADRSRDVIPDHVRNPGPPVAWLREIFWKSRLYRLLRQRLLVNDTSIRDQPLVLMPGVNEGLVQRVSPHQMVENLVALSREAREARLVIYVALPWRDSNAPRDAYADAVREASTQVGTSHFLDFNETWARKFNDNERTNLFLDSIHPNGAGCKQLADDLAELMVRHYAAVNSGR